MNQHFELKATSTLVDAAPTAEKLSFARERIAFGLKPGHPFIMPVVEDDSHVGAGRHVPRERFAPSFAPALDTEPHLRILDGVVELLHGEAAPRTLRADPLVAMANETRVPLVAGVIGRW